MTNMISSIANSAPPAGPGGVSSTDFLKKMFAKTDTDGDGKITKDEFVTAMEKRLGKSEDTNAPDPGEIFGKMDADSDGSITSTEFEEAFKSMKMKGGAQPPPPPPGPPPAEGSEEDDAKVFDALDTNKDGTVSFEELQAALSKKGADSSGTAVATEDLQSMFEAIDSDGDGAISGTEFKDMMAKMREGMPPPEPPGIYSLGGSATSPAGSGVKLNSVA